MRRTISRTWLAAWAVLTLLLVAGCSGGDNGISLTVDSALVGVWQPYAASMNDEAISFADAMGWGDHGNADVVNWEEVTFNANGTFVLKRFASANDFTTDSGTFTASQGEALLKPDGEEDEDGAFTYVLEGNVLVITFANDDDTIVTRWVKKSGITGTDSALLGFWTPTGVTVDGQAVPIADYFHFSEISADTDAAALQFLANGTFTLRYLEMEGPGGRVQNPTNLETAGWHTKDTRIVLTLPDQAPFYGVYVKTATTLEVQFLDVSRAPACAVTILFARWGESGNHPAALVGRWLAQTVTVNNTNTDLGDFFGWQNGVDSMMVEFYTDGAMESVDRAGAAVVSRHLGKWNSPNAGELNIIMDNVKNSTYSITGNTLSITILEDDDTVVLTFAKQP